jgi:DNA-binding protein H-NS
LLIALALALRPAWPIKARLVTSMEAAMAKRGLDLKALTVDQLIELRHSIDGMLSSARQQLHDRLSQIEGFVGLGPKASKGDRPAHPMRGRAVAPKYEGPNGELWAGRGAMPRWLKEELTKGAQQEDFLIDKSAISRSAKTDGKKAGRKKK